LIGGLVALLFPRYLAWRAEDIELSGFLHPQLSLHFSPSDNGCLHPAYDGTRNQLYIRVLPITLYRVNQCVGYLEGVYRRVNNDWQFCGYTDRRPLHWSTIHEQRADRNAEQPITVIRDSPQYLDIAFFIEGKNVLRLAVDIHPLNALSVFHEHADDLFRLDIRVVGQPHAEYVTSMTIQRGVAYNSPQVHLV
jgi:hypothetical protein